ncbi:MAG: hypothetical protein LBT18_04735 [Endomicrobium sp.]|nr:hypothetical protein [Endomicrobium sp.]
MSRLVSLMLAVLFVVTSSLALFSQQVKEGKTAKLNTTTLPFAVYVENNSTQNHFVPSGWMGDYGDIKVDMASTDNPKSGKTSIKVSYSAKMMQGAGWMGIYWQQPANNWGEKKGGYNLNGARRLTFWARGSVGGEKIAEFKVGGITGEFSDSDSAAIGPVVLTKNWKKYTIDLKDKDLTNIIGGFCLAASKDDNPNGFIIYLDDIIYE